MNRSPSQGWHTKTNDHSHLQSIKGHQLTWPHSACGWTVGGSQSACRKHADTEEHAYSTCKGSARILTNNLFFPVLTPAPPCLLYLWLSIKTVSYNHWLPTWDVLRSPWKVWSLKSIIGASVQAMDLEMDGEKKTLNSSKKLLKPILRHNPRVCPDHRLCIRKDDVTAREKWSQSVSIATWWLAAVKVILPTTSMEGDGT